MYELFATLGIDWKLLLAQAVNFGIVLFVLNRFVYRPLMRTMDERRNTIEQGLKDADAAHKGLLETNDARKKVLQKAEKEGQSIVERSKEEGQILKNQMTIQAEDQARRIVTEASIRAQQETEAHMKMLVEHAGELIASAIGSAVAKDPAKIDKSLISAAVDVLKKQTKSL